MTNLETRCPTCKGRAHRGSYGFIYCDEPTCIDNPASEAARIDRRATLEAVGEDTADKRSEEDNEEAED